MKLTLKLKVKRLVACASLNTFESHLKENEKNRDSLDASL
jgi:hypothetical protein